MICQPNAVVCAQEDQTVGVHLTRIDTQYNWLSVQLADFECGVFIY